MRLALLLFALLTAACASPPSGPAHARTADAASFPVEGLFARHLRLRLAPSHTQDFEALMERCVRAAQAAALPEAWDWLLYRESPGRYWIIAFAEEREGFALPRGPRPLWSFARGVADREGPAARAEVERRLAALEYVVEWDLLTRQKRAWSTVDSMSTTTHPEARLMLRTVRPGREVDFDRALTARTAFFREHGYPLPVEGFVILEGLPGHALQVVFPRDWPSFHAAESFWEFVQSRPEAERTDYLARKAALMETMASAEYHDASFLPEASYDAP